MARPRLDPDDWLDAGMDVLDEGGLAALTMDRVCQAMHRTVGSFSLYFESWNTYLSELVERWLDDRYRDEFLNAVATGTSPRDQLQAVLATGFALPAAGRHLRALALQHPSFARRLRRGDETSAKFLIELLRSAGVDTASAQLRGWALVAMFQGIPTLETPFSDDVVNDLQSWLLAPAPRHERTRATRRGRASGRHKKMTT